MNIMLEDRIKEAILKLHWKQAGDGASSNYFVSAPNDSVQLTASAASFLANYIGNYITHPEYEDQEDVENGELDKYSLEAIAGYLEDQGYTVSLPE
jgi:hypothetical protein